MSTVSQDYDVRNLKDDFVRQYGGSTDDVRVFSSPARINIIGEHIDYNGGKVFPAAIDRYLYVAIRRREDSRITYNDLKFPGTFSFDIGDKFSYSKENGYANYLNGILSILKRRGYQLPSGFDILLVSNVPPAGGISSSSALECGFAWAVSELFGLGVSRKDIALIGQQSEHEFMGVNCGIMDQYIIATGKKDTAEVLDCAKVEHEYVPLELGDYRFVVMNTRKKRQLADSKYNERRSQCEAALKILQDKGVEAADLCSLSPVKWEAVKHFISDGILQKRANHCVYENQRVIDAVAALKAGDLARLGRLLNESHASLKTDYEVTGIELDTLAETAQKQDGCLGARMTGAGFGGCAIALVHKDKVASFTGAVQEAYTAAIGYEAGFFSCSSGDGVSEVK
ncbi:MAG: galactokinase [Treponema sp.]|nr:galactokinase [Treponema sp.]MBQ7165712.1 galactokinase [Treponema sp.]